MRTHALFLIVLCGASAIATASSAGARDDVLSGISRCGSIVNDRSWLDCIYGAAQPMRAQLGLPPALASQQALVPPTMLEWFGEHRGKHFSVNDSSSRPSWEEFPRQ
jgi:hypothetical protein